MSMMSHELRSPLNGILGFAQILQLDKSMSERALSGLNIIRQSGDHLLTLINDILDMSKAEAGRMELFPEPVRLVEFLHVVATIVSVRAEQKSLVFKTDVDVNLPQSVLMDAKRMRQVLLNLLSNAVKFTDEGDMTFRVSRVAQASRSATLRFEIIDTGVGMSEVQQSRLFRPFEQVGSSKRRRVLVVDDLVSNRALLTDLFNSLGFEVDDAVNGEQGLARALSAPPDLVLMDVSMPVMDGVEATRRCAPRPGWPTSRCSRSRPARRRPNASA